MNLKSDLLEVIADSENGFPSKRLCGIINYVIYIYPSRCRNFKFSKLPYGRNQLYLRRVRLRNPQSVFCVISCFSIAQVFSITRMLFIKNIRVTSWPGGAEDNTSAYDQTITGSNLVVTRLFSLKIFRIDLQILTQALSCFWAKLTTLVYWGEINHLRYIKIINL